MPQQRPAFDRVINRIAEASAENNMDKYLEPWAEDGLLVDSHRKFWGVEAVRRYASLEWIGDSVTVAQVCDVAGDGPNYVAHILLEGDYSTDGLPSDLVMTFIMKLNREKIARLIVLPSNGRRLGKLTPTRLASTCFAAPLPWVGGVPAVRTDYGVGSAEDETADLPTSAYVLSVTSLPAEITAWLAAIQRSDLDGVLSTFSESAYVNDKHRDFWGMDSIRAWCEAEVIEHKMSLSVHTVMEHYGEIIVTASDHGLDKGLFDTLIRNSSVTALHGGMRECVMQLYFTLNNEEKIEQLVIIPIDGSLPIDTAAECFYSVRPVGS